MPAKIGFISDEIKYIKNTILSLNVEGLRLFILIIIPWAGRSRHCCFQTSFQKHFVVKYLKIYRLPWSHTRSYERWKQPRISQSTASWDIGNSFPGPINSQIQDCGSSLLRRTRLFYRSLHNLETCHRLESIQKSFLEAHISYASYLKYTCKRNDVLYKIKKTILSKCASKNTGILFMHYFFRKTIPLFNNSNKEWL